MLKTSGAVQATVKAKNSQSIHQPWSVLGAGTAVKPTKQLMRKPSEVQGLEGGPMNTDSSISGDGQSHSNSGSKQRSAARRKETKQPPRKSKYQFWLNQS